MTMVKFCIQNGQIINTWLIWRWQEYKDNLPLHPDNLLTFWETAIMDQICEKTKVVDVQFLDQTHLIDCFLLSLEKSPYNGLE